MLFRRRNMYPILLTLHIAAAVLLILVVLIQSGRSGGFSGLMGGGGGDALFSTSSQQSGLRKITAVIAFIFICTSFGLTILGSRQSNQSVFQKNYPALPPVSVPAEKQTQIPAAEIPKNLNTSSPVSAKENKK